MPCALCNRDDPPPSLQAYGGDWHEGCYRDAGAATQILVALRKEITRLSEPDAPDPALATLRADYDQAQRDHAQALTDLQLETDQEIAALRSQLDARPATDVLLNLQDERDQLFAAIGELRRQLDDAQAVRDQPTDDTPPTPGFVEEIDLQRQRIGVLEDAVAGALAVKKLPAGVRDDLEAVLP